MQLFRKARPLKRLAASVGFVALTFILTQAATALAQDAYVFNAALSLTGNCSTSTFDPVEDPGCPGGSHPPSGAFSRPISITTDTYGNIYVASEGYDFQEGTEARVDVFSPAGIFITELLVPTGTLGIAVDGLGNLYVADKRQRLLRYPPTAPYEPAIGGIAYGSSPIVAADTPPYSMPAVDISLAVDKSTQHVFAPIGPWVNEYGSAAEGNVLLDQFGSDILAGSSKGTGLAIDTARNRIYVAASTYENEMVIRVFDLAPPHAFIETIDGSTIPTGGFSGENSFLPLGVDEGSGNIFAYDPPSGLIYKLGEHGEYLETISHSLAGHFVIGAQIWVDNGEQSPNGALNPFGRYLFAPAFQTAPGHAFAFGPLPGCSPTIESIGFTGVTEAEAQLRASVQPCFLETSYNFEYTTERRFQEVGFTDATVAGSGQIPAGSAPVPVFASLETLAADTSYRFRLVVDNEAGPDEAEGEFATYPSSALGACPNDKLRTGASALLPDCRAYELVTPSNTSAHLPSGIAFDGQFATRGASPAGDQVTYRIEGGGMGNDGVGSFSGDPYRATRGEAGWNTTYTGPDGLESIGVLAGSNSPDQGYLFWTATGGKGSASSEGNLSSYLRFPDGHNAPIGRGSLRIDPRAAGRLISAQGSHVVFTSRLQLEEQAPAQGTNAIYDRTPDEVTHVVSLLPNDQTPAAGEDAIYEGASLDGKGIVFRIGDLGSQLYLRYDNDKTYAFGGPGTTFAGVAEGGKRVFYLEGGDLFAYEVGGTGNPIAFSTTGDVIPVNVSAAGGVAYFVSPSVLGGENPNGETPQVGKQNLYRSHEGAITFVGTVTDRDVEGVTQSTEVIEGLGLWTAALANGRFGIDPSRSTANGNVLLFESRAELTGYDSEGHTEVYRFDDVHGELTCLSCIPTLAQPTGNASLMSLKAFSKGEDTPLGSSALLTNLTADGRRAFFQSPEPLVQGDNDGLQDVYEWEAQGKGSCTRPGGCVYLISSGSSKRVDYLYAVSDSGDDVFLRTSDFLLASDEEETASIYDARVGGGFTEAVAERTCQGEGCRPGLTPPPALGSPGRPVPGAEDNVKPRKHCPKEARKVRRHGKARCVKRHPKHQRRAGHQKRGAGR